MAAGRVPAPAALGWPVRTARGVHVCVEQAPFRAAPVGERTLDPPGRCKRGRVGRGCGRGVPGLTRARGRRVEELWPDNPRKEDPLGAPILLAHLARGGPPSCYLHLMTNLMTTRGLFTFTDTALCVERPFDWGSRRPLPPSRQARSLCGPWQHGRGVLFQALPSHPPRPSGGGAHLRRALATIPTRRVALQCTRAWDVQHLRQISPGAPQPEQSSYPVPQMTKPAETLCSKHIARPLLSNECKW